ncbi:MAG: transglycosylase domain-containing protein, partial [Pseudomonadota bacterium]
MIQLIRQLIRAGMVIGLALLAGLVYMFWSYGRDLPDFAQLAQYKPPTVTRIYAGDGTLAREFASQNRVFLPIHSMPASLTQAFIAVEDQRFAHHKGIDPIALARAVIINIDNLVRGRRLIGASTITQQVAKNFLLTNEVSLSRKLREAVLALRIERVFSKTRIMELYLNEIYLGRGTYGVAAAALAYFDKSLAEL